MTRGAVGRIEAFLARRRLPDGDNSRLPFPDRPPGTDCLPQVRHIVILMMENHSFDNYLGTLGRGDGLPVDDQGQVSATNPKLDGTAVPATHMSSTGQIAGVPSQSWEATHRQWGNGRNDGFVQAVEADDPDADPSIAMGYWTEADLLFYHDLARTFPLADRWFASCLGPTFPNRRFLLSATANGLTTDSLSQILDYPENGTILDHLTRYGISWTNYHSVSHVGPVMQRLAGVHGLRAGRFVHGLVRRLRDLPAESGAAKAFLQFSADCYPLGMLRYLAHLRSIDRFCLDAAQGTLPAVSIVDPDFRANSEENPQDIRPGQELSARVINAAMHGAGWMGTLLIWCYDEHGGYYDHVPPPAAPKPDGVEPADGKPWQFDRYGFRVPAVVVSPYARAGFVSHVVRDHTAVLKLIERKWNLAPMTARDAAADDLLDMVDFDVAPAFAVPPELAPPPPPKK